MNPRQVMAGIVTLIAVLLGLAWQYQKHQPVSADLLFTARVGDAPLVLNSLEYANPNGEGMFKVRAFQFYISNIKLISESSVFIEPESYHLIRFDDASGEFRVTLKDVPPGDYQSVEFGIGVDPVANASIKSQGDLDPNGRMAWNWEVGYKFVLFEGGLELDAGYVPLVYHIGFNENYKTIEFPITKGKPLVFSVDVLAMFTHVHDIDMTKISNVKFDKAESSQLADNFAGMISQKEL